MKKGIFRLFVGCIVVVGFVVFSKQKADAALSDAACIGTAVGEYVNDVFDELGATREYGNVKLLSPAFNMTHPNFELLVETMAEELSKKGHSFGDFHAIAGNAYNFVHGGQAASPVISDWVTRARTTSIGNNKMVLTETGWYPPAFQSNDAIDAVGVEMVKMGGMNVEASLLFNIFGNNPDPNFSGHVFDNIAEIKSRICNGNCSLVGANSASYYSRPASSVYDKANQAGMRYVLEIGNDDTDRSFPALRPGIEAAHARGMIPIIRIGVGDSGGGFGVEEGGAAALASFIKDLSVAFPGGTIYVIVGPNEPISESWAAPDCDYGDGSGPGGPGTGTGGPVTGPDGRKYITISGSIRSSQIVTDVRTGATTTNRPINGALVISYEGDDKFGSGKRGDKLVFPVGWRNTKNGKFTVWARHSSDTRFEGSNYLAVICGFRNVQVQTGTDVDGNPIYGEEERTIVGDLYKVNTSKHISNFNLTVYCPPDIEPLVPDGITNSGELPFSLQELIYADKDEMLSCEKNKELYDGRVGVGQVKARIDVSESTDIHKGKHYGDATFPQQRVEVSREDLEGRTNLKQRNVDINAFRQVIAGIMGTPYGELETPKDGFENELIDCELIKECHEPISVDGGTGRNMQTCGNPGLTLAPPGYFKSLYLQADKTIPVCRNGGSVLTLGQIAPPESWEIGGSYTLDSSYFPYWSLTVDPSVTTEGKFFQEAVNDTFDNPHSAPCRSTPFPETQIAGRAEKAFGACSYAIYPSDDTGQFAGAIMSFLAGVDVYDYSDVGGPPTAVLRTPGAGEAADNPELQLPAVGGGGTGGSVYRIGHVEPLCTYSTMDPDRTQTTVSLQPPGESDDDQRGFAELSDRWSAGYLFITTLSENLNKSPPDLRFFEDPVDMNLFLGPRKNSYLYAEAHKGNWLAGAWENCVEYEAGSCAPGDTQCIPNGDNTARKTPWNAYTCDSKIKANVETEVNIWKAPHQEVSFGILDLYLPLAPPRVAEELWEVGTVDIIDVRDSKEEFWGDKQGFGLDSGGSGGTGGGVYYSDLIRNSVSDPAMSTPDPGSGPIPTPAGVNCDENAADPGAHNVKPVEELITSIQGTSYSANVDYDNIRKCYNDLINKAKATGNDPAFVMATWIEESGASNYTKFSTVYDFGCEVGGWPSNNYREQLRCMTGLQSAYSNNSNHEGCREDVGPTGYMTVQKFLYVFAGGEQGCLNQNYGSAPQYPAQIKMLYRATSVSGGILKMSCRLPSRLWDSACVSAF